MTARRFVVPFAMILLAAGCADQVGPPRPADAGSPTGSPRFLRWAESAQRFSAIGALGGGEGNLALGELGLHKYTATFWAVRGESRFVQINYQSGSDTTHPFLRLTIVDPRYVPGLGDVAEGDSVLITVRVDAENIGVSLEPTGLEFGAPASLRIWYGGAGGDLNGDGVVDQHDAEIEEQLLGMWYREGVLDPWTQIPAFRVLWDRSLTSALQHFSEYAVSW